MALIFNSQQVQETTFDSRDWRVLNGDYNPWMYTSNLRSLEVDGTASINKVVCNGVTVFQNKIRVQARSTSYWLMGLWFKCLSDTNGVDNYHDGYRNIRMATYVEKYDGSPGCNFNPKTLPAAPGRIGRQFIVNIYIDGNLVKTLYSNCYLDLNYSDVSLLSYSTGETSGEYTITYTHANLGDSYLTKVPGIKVYVSTSELSGTLPTALSNIGITRKSSADQSYWGAVISMVNYTMDDLKSGMFASDHGMADWTYWAGIEVDKTINIEK